MKNNFILKISIIIFSILLSFNTILGQNAEQDSTSAYKQFSKEDVSLVLSVFDGKKVSEIITKAELLVNSGVDASEKGAIAYYIYDYYRNSNIMGYDEIAIYFADNYILNDRYPIPSDADLFSIKLFAEFNRSSLIGMAAPELVMEDPSGANISILNGNQDYTILYFYEDDCSACSRTTPALMQYLSRIDGINFTIYMIYTQSDRERWMNYIKTFVHPFKLPETIKVVHLWDPEFTSNYPTKYGIISTPGLFLLDNTNTIIGRGLTPTALGQVVDVYESTPTPMESAIEQTFAPIEQVSDTSIVHQVIDRIFEQTRENPEMFHEVFYTMYQYLKNSTNYTFQQGAMYLGKRYIVDMPILWESVIFTSTGKTKGSVIRGDYNTVQEFFDETKLAIELFWRNPLGERITDLWLVNEKNKKKNLHSIEAKYTIVYFYSLSCGVCNAVTKELHKMYQEYKDKGLEVIAIYTGRDKRWKKYIKENGYGWVNLWDKKGNSGMFEKFDLLDVPAIYFLDENQTTIAKDINPDLAKTLLEYFTSEQL